MVLWLIFATLAVTGNVILNTGMFQSGLLRGGRMVFFEK